MLVPNMAEMCAQLCFAVAVGRIRMKGVSAPLAWPYCTL